MASDKLKTKLRLTSHRLRVQQKKKIENSLKAHKSVADCISSGRFEHARAQAEHIVREDFTAEALDLLEGYCDLLLARFGLYEAEKFPDENLLECVSTLVWAGSKIGTTIPELNDVAKMIREKYGAKFCEDVINNGTNVNVRVRIWLSEAPPPEVVVERYMVEIAESAGLKYKKVSVPGPDDGSTTFLWQRDVERAAAKVMSHASCDVQLNAFPDPSGVINVTEAKHDLGAVNEDEDHLLERLNRLKQS